MKLVRRFFRFFRSHFACIGDSQLTRLKLNALSYRHDERIHTTFEYCPSARKPDSTLSTFGIPRHHFKFLYSRARARVLLAMIISRFALRARSLKITNSWPSFLAASVREYIDEISSVTHWSVHVTSTHKLVNKRIIISQGPPRFLKSIANTHYVLHPSHISAWNRLARDYGKLYTHNLPPINGLYI